MKLRCIRCNQSLEIDNEDIGYPFSCPVCGVKIPQIVKPTTPIKSEDIEAISDAEMNSQYLRDIESHLRDIRATCNAFFYVFIGVPGIVFIVGLLTYSIWGK